MWSLSLDMMQSSVSWVSIVGGMMGVVLERTVGFWSINSCSEVCIQRDVCGEANRAVQVPHCICLG